MLRFCSVLLLVLQLSTVTPQLCNVIRTIKNVRLIPAPFLGQTPVNPGTCPEDPMDNLVCAPGTVLLDNNIGPEIPDLDLNSDRRLFVGWSVDLSTPFLSFNMANDTAIISAIDLYVLNYPEGSISVPNFELYQTPDPTLTEPSATGVQLDQVEFDLMNNDQLSRDDLIVRRITLRPRVPFASPAVLVRWDFTDVYNVELFVISEVQICGDAQPDFTPSEMLVQFLSPATEEPVSVQPSAEFLASEESLILTCTVSQEGSFEWRWRRDTVDLFSSNKTRILSADGTRTSKLNISEPDFEDAGQYSCDASFDSLNSFRTRRHNVEFPLSVSVAPTSEGFLGEGSAQLHCEMSGYASFSSLPTWTDGSGMAITDTTKYSITLGSGSNSLIYSNGSTGPSIVSTLTIGQLSIGDEGSYSCSVETLSAVTTVRTTQLVIMDGTVPSTFTEAPTESPTTPGNSSPVPDGSSIPLIAGVVATLLILIIAIIAVIILILIVLHARRKSPSPSVMVRRRSSSGNDSTELQQHLTKEDIEWQIPHAQNGVAVSTAGEEAVYSNDLMDSDVLYASVSSKAPPKSHLVPNFLETDSSSRDPLMSSCADTDGAPITKNGGIDYSTEAPPPPPPPMSAQSNIYQEVRPPMKRRMTNSSAPNLAKLRGTPGTSAMELDSNPIYESSANIEPDKQVLVQPAGAETTTTTEEKPDTLYAQPIKRKPSAPKPSTPAPETSEPIYSEALTPAMFKQPPPDPSVPLHPYGPIYAEPTVAKKTDAVREVDVANFEEKGLIGIGQFGEVMLAETVGLSRKDLGLTPADDDRSISIKVAIKKLQSDAQAAVRENFDKEIRFMSKLHDDNIIMLLAVGTGVEPFIVMEYMENGDLHQYLEEYRDIVTTPAVRQGQIPLSVLVYMAKQVASGMRYLASHNYVHRDLATRNCLVGKDYTVKIADFGMSRNLYSQSYYKVRGRAMLPIRWMAPESFFGRFSEKTDIWSFGVVMWEIFTLCKQQPYEEMTDQEVIQDATKEEGRALLDRPEACPEGVYDVMMSCWVTKSQERAGFAEVLESLTAIYRSM